MRSLLMFGLPAVLMACGDKSEDTAAVSEYDRDDDGDGYAEVDGDCDDADSAIGPQAEELCDGVDNDCDGLIDDGAGDLVDFYLDRDGDGAGDGETVVQACAQPEGTASVAGDCDDLDAAVNPEALEVCNGLDDDCDGQIDDADDSVDPGSFSHWYADTDGDGYGDPDADLGAGCTQPSGAVADDGDCDDNEAGINPGQTEVCDDLDRDEDCNGLADDADEGVYAAGKETWYLDADGDGFGDETDLGVARCDDPSADELAYSLSADDCEDVLVGVYPGAPEVCADGVVNDCDGTEADATEICAWGSDLDSVQASTIIAEDADDTFSWYARGGDLDGDGTQDLVIGSPWSSAGEGTGMVYALMGPLTAASYTSSDDVMVEGQDSETFGVDPAVGDVDGDGYDDVFLGAPGADIDGSNEGAAYLLLGPLTSGVGAEMATLAIEGDGSSDYLGSAQAIAGDHDGDGLSDVLTAAVGHDEGGSFSGVALLFSGAAEGTQDEGDALAMIEGDQRSDAVGMNRTLVGGEDLNGDGLGDIVIGVGRYDYQESNAGGAVFIFEGPVSGTMDITDADSKVVADTSNSYGLGYGVAAGDLDGDGQTDLFVGAPSTDVSVNNGGMGFVMLGPITADSSVLTDAWMSIVGAEDEYLGGSAAMGDFDADGAQDLLIGSGAGYMTSNSATYQMGNAAWIETQVGSGTYASADLGVRISGVDSEDHEEGFGRHVAALGDQDGDLGDEALVLDSLYGSGDWHLFHTPSF